MIFHVLVHQLVVTVKLHLMNPHVPKDVHEIERVESTTTDKEKKKNGRLGQMWIHWM